MAMHGSHVPAIHQVAVQAQYPPQRREGCLQQASTSTGFNGICACAALAAKRSRVRMAQAQA